MRSLPFDDPSAPLYSVGQAAEMLGLHPSFLRRLDDQGVVTPARSAGDQRRYSRADVESVGRVADLMDEGLTLNGVRRVLELQREIDDLRRQIADLSGRTPRGAAGR